MAQWHIIAMPPDHNRIASDKQADSALRKSPKELLSDIHYEIEKWDDLKSPHRVQFAFASLFSVLAEQASNDTRKIVRLTWWLLGLTCVFLAIAAIQIVIMLVKPA